MKPRVLLVPKNFYSAEGIIARALAEQVEGVDFYFFASDEIDQRPKEFLDLLAGMDVVHWLKNLCNIRLPESVDPANPGLPSVASLYHIGEREESKLVFAQNADVIHVISDEWKEKVSILTKTKVRLAYPGFNFMERKQVPGRRKAGGTAFRIGVFCFAKDISDRKRIDVLISALSLLKKMTPRSIELVVQGGRWSKFKPWFNKAGIPLRELGFLPVVESLKTFSEIDCYVCSSEVEGGPLTILESLACGVPVVSTEVGLAKELLPKGGGVLCPINDAKALAEGILKLINDSDFYGRCVHDGPVTVDTLFKRRSVLYREMYEESIREWSLKHGQPWLLKSTAAPPPAKQRKRELGFDLFCEAASMMRKRYFWNGFRLSLSALLNNELPLYFRMRSFLSCQKLMATRFLSSGNRQIS